MFCISWNDCVNSLDFWNLPAKADFFAGFWNLPEKVRFFFCCDVCFLELLMMGSSVRVDFLSLVFYGIGSVQSPCFSQINQSQCYPALEGAKDIRVCSCRVVICLNLTNNRI